MCATPVFKLVAAFEVGKRVTRKANTIGWMARKTYDFLFKLLLVGDNGVGKTELVVMFTEMAFNLTFMSTVGKGQDQVAGLLLYIIVITTFMYVNVDMKMLLLNFVVHIIRY